eukprot:scaffold50_cov162-Ochromonas_danica.AAC.6
MRLAESYRYRYRCLYSAKRDRLCAPPPPAPPAVIIASIACCSYSIAVIITITCCCGCCWPVASFFLDGLSAVSVSHENSLVGRVSTPSFAAADPPRVAHD